MTAGLTQTRLHLLLERQREERLRLLEDGILQFLGDAVVRQLEKSFLETGTADLVDEVLFRGEVGTVECCCKLAESAEGDEGSIRLKSMTGGALWSIFVTSILGWVWIVLGGYVSRSRFM